MDILLLGNEQTDRSATKRSHTDAMVAQELC